MILRQRAATGRHGLARRRRREHAGWHAGFGALLALAMANPDAVTAQTTPERPLGTRLSEPLDPGAVQGAVGVAHLRGFQNALSGLSGNLTRIGVVQVRVGVSPNVEFGIAGSVSDRLQIRERKLSGIPLDVPLNATQTSDWGTVRLSTLFALRPPAPARIAWGGHLIVSLPTTNEQRGIGTNTMDVSAAISLARHFPRAGLFAHVGVAILTAPLTLFEQNDVGVYGFAATYDLAQGWTVFGEVEGRRNFRELHRTPLETESRSALRLGIATWLAGMRCDFTAQRGLTRWDPRWGVTAGFVRTVRSARKQG